MHNVVSAIDGTSHEIQIPFNEPQALVSFKKYMPPPLPYFKVNIYPFPLAHFAKFHEIQKTNNAHDVTMTSNTYRFLLETSFNIKSMITTIIHQILIKYFLR